MKLPCQSGNLIALVNTDDAATNPDYLRNVGPGGLLTDVSYFERGMQFVDSAYDVCRILKTAAPSATIGRYHSSLYAIDKNTKLEQFGKPVDAPKEDPRLPGIGRVPFEHYVPVERFAESELLPAKYNHPLGMRAVDFRLPDVRAKLVAMIVDDAMRMGATALMTDEWSPSATWDGTPWIDAVIAYQSQLNQALRNQNIPLFCNMHFRIGGANNFDGTDAPRIAKDKLTAIASNCALVLLERACDPEAKPQDVVSDYQIIAATGTACVLMGEPEFMAALSMLTATYKGPLNYVGYAVWQPEPAFKWWAARYGNPKGDIKWLDAMRATRQFANGLLAVDFEKRTAVWQ